MLGMFKDFDRTFAIKKRQTMQEKFKLYSKH